MTVSDLPRLDTGHGWTELTDALHAEWTKFRTVRGWMIGLVLVAVLLVLFAYLTANGEHSGICALLSAARMRHGGAVDVRHPGGRVRKKK